MHLSSIPDHPMLKALFSYLDRMSEHLRKPSILPGPLRFTQKLVSSLRDYIDLGWVRSLSRPSLSQSSEWQSSNKFEGRRQSGVLFFWTCSRLSRPAQLV